MTRGVVGGQEVGEDLAGDLLGELGAVEAGVGGDPDQRALELADVVADVGGDEGEDFGRDAAEVLGLGLLAEDGEAGLELGWLDVGDEAPLEPGAEAVLEGGDRLRRPVGRDDDLAALAVELVERVEELLLELLGALEELDVVDQEHVEVAVATLEARHRLGPDGVDELVHERLGGDVAHPLVAEHGAHVVADRVEQVGLAEPGGPVDEQRVVGPARALGDRQRGGVGEAVRRADDELVEGVAGVQRARGPGAGARVVDLARSSRQRVGAGAWRRARDLDGDGVAERRRLALLAVSVSTSSSTRTVAPVRSRMASVSMPE